MPPQDAVAGGDSRRSQARVSDAPRGRTPPLMRARRRSISPPRKDRALSPPTIRRTDERTIGAVEGQQVRNRALSPSVSRRHDRPRSPSPVHREEHRVRQASLLPHSAVIGGSNANRNASSQSRQRKVSPSPERRRRDPSPPPTSFNSSLSKDKYPMPMPYTKQASPPVTSRSTAGGRPSLLSRLGPSEKLEDPILSRDIDVEEGPPSKKVRRLSNEAAGEVKAREAENTETGDQSIDMDMSKTHSPSPRRPRSPITILGASRKGTVVKALQEGVASNDTEEDPVTYVDIAELPGVILEEEVLGKMPLIRLYNPNTGSSTDARAVLKHIESSASSTSPADIRPSPGIAISAQPDSKPILFSGPGRLPPSTAIPGLPAKPVVTEATFDTLRERRRPLSPAFPRSGHDRDGSSSNRDSRETYRSMPVRKEVRNVDIDSYRPSKPRALSRSRSPPPAMKVIQKQARRTQC